MCENLRRTEIGTSVDNTNNDSIICAVGTDTVDVREEDVGAVAASLIPALDGGANGASSDGEEELLGHAPLVRHLLLEDLNLALREGLVTIDVANVLRVLRHESALLEDGDMLLEAAPLSKGLDIAHELRSRDAFEGVANPTIKHKKCQLYRKLPCALREAAKEKKKEKDIVGLDLLGLKVVG